MYLRNTNNLKKSRKKVKKSIDKKKVREYNKGTIKERGADRHKGKKKIMEKKTTVLEHMNNVRTFLVENNASQELVDFMDARIALQEKKRASKSTELTETQKENLVLKDKVFNFIQENPKSTAKVIASHFGISSQKLTPIMSKLLVDGSVVFETVKKVKYFTVVE